MTSFKVTEHPAYLAIDFLIPESANALSLAAAQELRKIVAAHLKWKKPVIVSSLHARVFCSGGNLSDYKKLNGKAPGLKINREISACLNAFGAWNVSKLAIIEGDVLGGGLEWLARFDYRWTTPNALFAFWQRRIGLSTGWGGGKAWSALIGESEVRRLLMEGRCLSAAEAERIGLVDRLISPWKIRDEAEAWAARMEFPAPIGKWKATTEQTIFSGLWMAPAHRAVLKNWRK